MTTSLMDPNDIRLAKQFSGVGDRINIPFIPVVRINNKDEEKTVEIEGVETKVIVPARKGFLIKTKNEKGEYNEEFWKEELEGVILKERYEIQSKFDIEERYSSFEFDTWTEPIKITDKNKRVLIEAPYKELKETFSTGEKDSFGNDKKTFDLFLVLYINVEGEVKRFKWKMSQNNQWFTYKASFNEDTYVGYKTKFNLIEEKKGDNTFWVVSYEKGEPVDLKEQIELQKQILTFMGALKKTYGDIDKWNDGASLENGNQTKAIQAEDLEEDYAETSIENIPF